eukprot:m.958298 g.958298  ORF g.958298 m.958298 type:complete len:370 (-) comp23879_c0_seq19:214-1323(-)
MRVVVLEEGELVLLEGELKPEPSKNEILISVRKCAAYVPPVKSLSLFQPKKHQYPVGHDICGIVEQVGADVQRFKIGDYVVAMLPLDSSCSGLAEYALVNSACAVVKPSDVSPADCVVFQRAGIQAYTALHYQMRATKGDVILITRGAHGARTAILNLAQHWGFRVLVTAYSQEEFRALQQHVNETQIIDISAGTSITAACTELTGGLGVDGFIDAGDISDAAGAAGDGPTKHEVLSCLGVGGKWVTMVPNLQLDPPDAQLLYWKGCSVCFLNEHAWTLSGSQQGRFLHMLTDLMAKIERKVIQPIQTHEQTIGSVKLINTVPSIGSATVISLQGADPPATAQSYNGGYGGGGGYTSTSYHAGSGYGMG